MAFFTAFLSGVCLFGELNLLFLLVVLEQHVVAAALLLGFFYTLTPPTTQALQPRTQLSDESELTHHPHALTTPAPDADPAVCVQPPAPEEGAASQPSLPREQHHADTPEPRCCVDGETSHGDGNKKVSSSVCMEARVESSNTTGSWEEATAILPTSDTRSTPHRHLALSRSCASNGHFAWICAVAVLSALSLCGSVALWLTVSRCPPGHQADAECKPPAWTSRLLLRTVLAVFTGIRFTEGGIHTGHFFFTVVSFTIIAVLSIGHALAALLCRRRRAARVTPRVDSRAARVIVTTLTRVPLSLLCFAVTGIGQGTLFGCVYVLLALVMALFYPGCVLMQRRWFWLAYLSLSLGMWVAQECLRLRWVDASLVAYATAGSAARQRTLELVGLLVDSNAAATDQRWRRAQAAGLWWAGAEIICFHTALYARRVAAQCEPPQGLPAVVYRERLTQALLAKERRQVARAMALQRAAVEKVAELRRARSVTDSSLSAAEKDQGQVDAIEALGSRVPRSCIGATQHAPLPPHGPFVGGRPCAPFGSVGSQCCWPQDRSSTLAVQGSQPHSPAAAAAAASAHSRVSRCSARTSHSTSSHGSRCAAPRRTSAVTSAVPPPAAAAAAVSQLGRRESWASLLLCSAGDDGSVGRMAPPCPAATAIRTAENRPLSRTRDAWQEPNALPPYLSQRWAREPTKSPAASVNSDDDDDNDSNEDGGAGRLIDLLNTSLVARQREKEAAVAVMNLRELSLTSTLLASAPRRETGKGIVSRGFSPFHSPASVSIAGFSPIVEEPPLFPSSFPPPVVDSTAIMHQHSNSSTSEGAGHDHTEARATDTLDASDTPAVLVESEAPLGAKVLGLWSGVRKTMCAYLMAHTLCVHTTAEQGETSPSRRLDSVSGESESAGIANNAAAAPLSGGQQRRECANSHPHKEHLWELLQCYLHQHWLWVYALLALVHFTVASTALNLVPSAACLVYALLQRPWPAALFSRTAVVFAVVAVAVKSAVRTLLVCHVLSTSSPTSAQWIRAVALSVRVCEPPGISPASPAVEVSAGGREPWADMALSLVVLAAALAQWHAVYGDDLVVVHCGARRSQQQQLSLDAEQECPSIRRRGGERDDRTVPASPMASSGRCSTLRQRLSRWNRGRRGAGADYYSVQLFFDVLALVLFCWAYYAIAPQDTSPAHENFFYAVQHNQLPGTFVATTLGLVVVVFAERVIYALHARVAKLALHVFLAVVYHVLYLVWRAAYSGSCGSSSGSGVSASRVTLLMAVKLASLWCSALQLRHGYPLHRTHDPFTVKTDLLHWLGHMVFRTVPFLMELRVLLDWSVSTTALKVQHWMLLEDLHHTVYRRYVDMHDLHWTSRHQGRRFPYYVRVYQGMFSFAAILLVLFFPLFWYSTFGPQVHASQVTAWSTDVSFSGLAVLPLFSADATLAAATFRDVTTAAFGDVLPAPATLLRYAAVGDTWQHAHVAQCSSRMWTYTPSALAQLLGELESDENRVSLTLRSRVTRSHATEALYSAQSIEETYTLPAPAVATLASVLREWQRADSRTAADSSHSAAPASASLRLPSFYAPFIVSTGTSVAAVNAADLPKADCALTLHRVGQYQGYPCLACGAAAVASLEESEAPSAASVSSLSESTASSERSRASAGLSYVVASADVTTVQSSLSLIPDVGVVALYTSFILVMSTYIRNFFAGDAHRVVLLQLANPEPVAELLRYIYLTRSVASNGHDESLHLEQLLFLELLDLLRSPCRLMALGGRRADDYAHRVYRQDLYEVTKRPFDLRR